jgi:hypothetical protein
MIAACCALKVSALVRLILLKTVVEARRNWQADACWLVGLRASLVIKIRRFLGLGRYWQPTITGQCLMESVGYGTGYSSLVGIDVAGAD